MPLGGAMNVEMLVPTRTQAQASTGELQNTFSYDGVSPLYVHFYERGSSPVQQPFGQYLNVDAIAIIEGTVDGIEPVEASSSAGNRTQVKINGVKWEVSRVRPIGLGDKDWEIQLRRWK